MLHGLNDFQKLSNVVASLKFVLGLLRVKLETAHFTVTGDLYVVVLYLPYAIHIVLYQYVNIS
jgi:hypothetical protein